MQSQKGGLVPDNQILKSCKCNNCNRLFNAQVFGNKLCGRIPILLPCGHLICEDCIKVSARNCALTCIQCDSHVKFNCKERLRDILPVDRYALGSILNLEMSHEVARSSANFYPAGALLRQEPFKVERKAAPAATDHNDAKQSKGNQLCSQKPCCKNDADWNCVDCNALYCNVCNIEIHEKVRALHKHNRHPISAVNISQFRSFCDVHKDAAGEYFCDDCQFMLCSHCVIKDHQGHRIQSLESKNAEHLLKLSAVADKAGDILKMLQHQEKKIIRENAAPPNKTHLDNVRNMIVQHFIRLHSQLQLLETKMLNAVQKAPTNRPFSAFRDELTESLNTIAPLVSTSRLVLGQHKTMHFDVQKVCEALDQVLDIPCVIEKCGEGSENVQFVADENILDTLMDHCRIETGSEDNYRFVSLSECNAEYLEEIGSDISSTSSVSSDNVSLPSTSARSVSSTTSEIPARSRLRLNVAAISNPLQDTTAPAAKTDLLEKGSIQTVIVTHIKNPVEFYLQLVSRAPQLDKLSQTIHRFAKHAQLAPTIETNHTYIVLFVTHCYSRWERGLVKRAFDCEDCKMYEVFSIDYGNTVFVKASQIKPINAALIKDPPYAYKCSIFDIEPIEKDWSEEVLNFMVTFLTSVDFNEPCEQNMERLMPERFEKCKMYIKDIDQKVFNVDLIAIPQDHTHKQTSLRDALLFQGHVKSKSSVTSKDYIARNNITQEKKIIVNLLKFRENKIYDVFVSHVDTPADLYIQAVENIRIINDLKASMAKYYKDSTKGLVYVPTIGMLCIAKFAIDQSWYRAEVIQLPGKAKVTVFALDYGYTEDVPWTDIRKIQDQYINVDAQAIKVSLADIKPVSDSWSCEGCNYLTDYTKGQPLKMIVEQKYHSMLLITLFKTTPTTDICINSLMVSKGLAVSTGTRSTVVEHFKIIPSEDATPKKKLYMDDLLTSIQGTTEVQSIEQYKVSDEIKNSYYTAISVLSIETPGLFYITLPEWHKLRNRIKRNLEQFYKRKSPSVRNWKVDEKCVVQKKSDMIWYRGVILKIEGKTYTVRLIDVAQVEVVTKEYLYTLDQKFLSPHDLMIKCHLAGVRPAGGVDKWTFMSVEYFKELVTKYHQLYITKMGTIGSDQSLPVVLMTMWEEPGGPLDSASVKYVIVNKCLIDKGVALPVKPHCDSFNIPEKLELGPNDVEKNALVKPGKQTKWLPARPFDKAEFKGEPTYVDNNGYVYIHSNEQKPALKNLQAVLKKYFEGSVPDAPHDWRPGQICIVQYHLDDGFYRSRVKKINDDGTIHVIFIDYGNVEDCPHKELRSEIPESVLGIPTMAVKCRLAHIAPKPAEKLWPTRILDYLHAYIVEKQCDVSVVYSHKVTQDGIPDVVLCICESNVNVNTALMTMDWENGLFPSNPTPDVVNEPDADVIIETTTTTYEDADITFNVSDLYNSKYEFAKVPDNLDSFEAEIINVIDYKTVVVEPQFLTDSLKSTQILFNELCEEINEKANDQKPIINPCVGMPCCVLYSEDQKWYRAIIYSTAPLCVYFVDYGNVERVLLKHVRKMKHFWFSLPVQLLACNIWGIEKAEDVAKRDATNAVTDAMLDNQFRLNVKRREPALAFEFLDIKSNVLAYEQAITDGFVHVSP